ncbi:hypothetical protein FNV43_RR02653 [Rhamnella rubrinervis]|uniref:AP2/ERF domain-containing protein n=1 Tax=Rhamnella rubrinervis TaxID=2594499 RepID=A0A8K0HSJ6_9ROSA|nr:hypothetical protein FNV43_RR02653 [Rhamnella rubrinervis]
MGKEYETELKSKRKKTSNYNRNHWRIAALNTPFYVLHETEKMIMSLIIIAFEYYSILVILYGCHWLQTTETFNVLIINALLYYGAQQGTFNIHIEIARSACKGGDESTAFITNSTQKFLSSKEAPSSSARTGREFPLNQNNGAGLDKHFMPQGEASEHWSRPKARDNSKHPVYRSVRIRSWGKWVSEIREPHKKNGIYLGTFLTPEMAARAHDVAALSTKGSSAILNFPELAGSLPRPVLNLPRDVQAASSKAASMEVLNTTSTSTTTSSSSLMQSSSSSTSSSYDVSKEMLTVLEKVLPFIDE